MIGTIHRMRTSPRASGTPGAPVSTSHLGKLALAVAILWSLAPLASARHTGSHKPTLPSPPQPQQASPQDPGQGAQDQGPPAPRGPDARGVEALVEGQTITTADVEYHQLILTGSQGDTDDPELRRLVVREIASQILLSQEAERLGLDLPLSVVDSWWKERHGAVPPYEENAQLAGTTVAQQRLLAKRVAQAEIYLLNRLDLRTDHGLRIKPHLALARSVKVTPQELRDYFLKHRDQLGQPPLVAYEVFPCADLDSARLASASLLEGRMPVDMSPSREATTLPLLDEVFSYAPEIADFLRNGVVDAVSQPFEFPEIVLVFRVRERREGVPADFAQIQDRLRDNLQGGLIGQAREQLVRELARGAAILPNDLFNR